MRDLVRALAVLILAVALAAPPAAAETTGGHAGSRPEISIGAELAFDWPEAITRLRSARESAVGCARQLKATTEAGSDARRTAARLYSEARAGFNGTIAGLRVVLAEGGAPPDLATLEGRLATGTERGERFCEQVDAVLATVEGEKSGVLKFLKANGLQVLLEAVARLLQYEGENDAIRRETIRNELEGALWPEFREIAP
jgi:hypothetical protein